jgi:DNA helicase-2/ATP-dependent DNA helicase PcrA
MINSKLLENLNEEQMKAVTHKSGPLLIIAGAGTGKTKVITHRIAWLIEQKLARPEEILALTFTEKSAAEMEERVDKLVPYGFVDTWISTFHAFGDRIIRDYSLDLGLPANFKVLSETEQAIFFKENIFAFDLKYFRPLSNPLTHIEEMLSHFSRLKDELITCEEYLLFAKNNLENAKLDEKKKEADKTLELANAYQRYNELMIESGNLDYGDQIFFTYRLLKENSNILKELKNKFKFILVDEFQDTNYAQNEIIKLICGENGNITVVGDDDQSIYRFRGASISNILDFKSCYKNITEVVLNKNYRSTQQILDSAYKLITHNNPDRLEIKNKINKKLVSDSSGPNPELIYADTLSTESDLVAKKIAELKNKEKLSNKDFAILVRANTHTDPFLESLNMAGIEYIYSGASDLYNNDEIRMLISFLKCIVYNDDNLSFYKLATSDLYNISHDFLTNYYTKAKRETRTIKEIFENSEGYKNKDDQEKIKRLIFDIDKYSNKKNMPAGEVLYEYLTEKKYIKGLISNLSIENELKLYNIAKFFDKISEYNHSASDKSILAFLSTLETLLEFSSKVASSDIDPNIDAVNILTVHAAKGLEWPVVFIVNCVSDRFPSRNRREQLPINSKIIKEKLPEGDFHIQEERRLFYVAATRAKKYLFLTAGENYGGKRAKKISNFVMEFLDNVELNKTKIVLDPMQKISKFKKYQYKATKIPTKFNTKIIKLSRQQIDDYYTCPKKFYFAHIVKIRLLENYNLIYGTAIHSALDHYFNKKINNEKVTVLDLLNYYEEAFKNVGFITREHEEKVFQNGKESLVKFYNMEQRESLIPTSTEESFEFLEGGIKINGRYDLIYKHGDYSEIRDFKTSNITEQKDADRRIKESTQMMIYALAWQKKYNQIPKTTLYFIESNLTGEIFFSPKIIEKTKEIIHEVEKGIRENNMQANPDTYKCSYCAYKNICPYKI